MGTVKIKYTKTERARQKKVLKVSERMLPLFEAMEKSLMTTIISITERIDLLNQTFRNNHKSSEDWIAVIADSWAKITDYIAIKEIITQPSAVAGIRVQQFDRVEFIEKSINDESPLWVNDAVILIKEQFQLLAEIKCLKDQINLLEEELLDVRARVKLFENRRIPNAKMAIRKIGQKLQDDERLTIATAKVVKTRG